MKKKFTLDLWKKCLGNMYEHIPLKYFFSYIDIIQIFIDRNSIFLFAPNTHVKLIVDRYYYNIIIYNIRKYCGDSYLIYFAVGLIYINDTKKISISLKSLKISSIDLLKKDIDHFYESNNCKNFFIYINIQKKNFLYKKKKIMAEIKNCGFSGIKTSLFYLLNNEEKIKCIFNKYDLLVFCEQEYNCDFFLLLYKNIHKIKPLVESNNILFLSESSFDVLTEHFLKILFK